MFVHNPIVFHVIRFPRDLAGIHPAYDDDVTGYDYGYASGNADFDNGDNYWTLLNWTNYAIPVMLLHEMDKIDHRFVPSQVIAERK